MKAWYAFSKERTDGHRDLVETLGGKGANLAEMSRLGIPVPPGFTLPTDSCRAYYDDGSILAPNVLQAIDEGVTHIQSSLEDVAFGDTNRPLLLSVRSGARASMPGMMDTVLNIGLTQASVEGLAATSGSRRFALDSYRRLIQMFGDVVCGVDRHALEEPVAAYKNRAGYQDDSELTEGDLSEIVNELLSVFERHTGEQFPQDPNEQLRRAVAAVFGSWQTRRAKSYRQIHGIPDAWGTAANVQAMVFGNFGDASATGVAFSRDPSTGARQVMGEWLPNAQGEDVVAGIRTPGPLHRSEESAAAGVGSLQAAMPEAYDELLAVMERLEQHYGDMQDVEFTVQEGTVYLLQTRAAKRTARSAVRSAVEMVEEGLIDKRTALMRVSPDQLNQLLHPQLDPEAPKNCLAKGLAASPGAASGIVVISPDRAEELAADGVDLILVRRETSPEDIHGMYAARGILTATGGLTSHAAVVARGMGRPCVSGCQALVVDEANNSVVITSDEGDIVVAEGESLTIDGATGEIFAGTVATIAPELGEHFETLLGWADDVRTLGVRTNADTPEDAASAVKLGAEGIGLCRTEHMFFAPDRILAMREMILATDTAARLKALEKLEPMQRQDFVGIFEAMAGRPVTIRLLDPPLHEFLPQTRDDVQALAADLGLEVEAVQAKTAMLHEFNPMVGHRGCRLGLAYPEIVEMQTRAIVEAAAAVAEKDTPVRAEIMIPLVMEAEELRRLRSQIETVRDEIAQKTGTNLSILIGTMIELPRACLVADEIAKHADFFSFGTNDLTQTTLGISRDDAGRYLGMYVEDGILSQDPFASVDRSGVGKLVAMATELGRAANPKLKVGICGEHGGDPLSIDFFASVGLDYVSCSPFRLPVARLAAAQAAIQSQAE